MKELYVLINEKIRVLVVRGKGKASALSAPFDTRNWQVLLPKGKEY